MEDTGINIWSKILEVVRKELNPQSYETWFIHTKPVSYSESEGVVVVETPNSYFRDWLIDHYSDLIEQAAKRAATQKVKVKFIVASAPAETGEIQAKRPRTPTAGRPRLRSPAELESSDQLSLNDRFTFENFVVGPSNRFSHAASLAVAESPAKAYNPLFIYGGVGLGKTHLLQAIGHFIAQRDPTLKLIYISSERFTNQLISAIQNRTTLRFRQMYRGVDVLLIDDIRFIAGKESTQEEFFHTFNTLYDAHKQIVLSSDRPPKDIAAMEKRLVSRFEWGLITDIQPPDLETRIAILRKKAEREVVEVPEDVTFFIADKISTNIRELEGALIRVVAYSSLIGCKVTVDLAREILKDMLQEERRVTIEMVQKRVAEYFNVRVSDMKSKRRSRSVAYPRQIAMYLARDLTDFSLPQIGEYFGGRDHSTVLHAHNKVRSDVETNQKIRELVEALISELKK